MRKRSILTGTVTGIVMVIATVFVIISLIIVARTPDYSESCPPGGFLVSDTCNSMYSQYQEAYFTAIALDSVAAIICFTTAFIVEGRNRR